MSGQVKIPKIIHMVWIGPKPFPHERYRQTWADQHPDWEVRLWTDSNLPQLHNAEVYERLSHLPYAVRADLLRLELLARYGGLYTDADSTCLRPIDDLIADTTLFGMTGNNGNVANGTLGATAGHPAYRALVDGAAWRYHVLRTKPKNTDPGYEVFDLFGTRYITPLLRAYDDFTQIDGGEQRGTRRLICVNGIDIGPDTYIAHDNGSTWKNTNGAPNRFSL